MQPVRRDDALRLPLLEANKHASNPDLIEGFLFVDLPDWRLEDWANVEVRARASAGLRNMGLLFNYSEVAPRLPDIPFISGGDRTSLVSDGTIQTYRLSLDSSRMRRWEGPWTHLGLWFNANAGDKKAALDLISVRVIPAEAEFAAEGVGVQLVGRSPPREAGAWSHRRRAIFMHAPGRIAYGIQIPRDGRLDVGLGVLSDGVPVKFRIEVTPTNGATVELLDESWGKPAEWAQRSVDLAAFAGKAVTITLSVASEHQGSVAFWGAPTLSGSRATRPNVILYVIDGAGPGYMSVYDYNRRTTPHLERVAAQGALFERAYSNSSWTRSSTPSFLTSLQHSVLGGLVNGRNPVPEGVMTMAEHFHRAGYQTALLTTNPNAGGMSSLDRGVDVFRDSAAEGSTDSAGPLHEIFWKWRENYPGQPYFVHFQTTDVHEPHDLRPPFSGLFIASERRARVADLEERLESADLWGPEAQRRMGDDWLTYAGAKRDLYDESMAYQDYQIGRLVERLKAAGEWERTLLIVASDHGIAAGSQDWEILMQQPVPAAYDFSHRATPMFRPGVSRIPLILVWPERIAPGQRFEEPVSMLDLLPTALELSGLPMPRIFQGQSLMPILLGREGWERQPVIFDQFEADPDTGELGGRIEVVDERWGASLEIHPKSASDDPGDRRPAPLLVFDLWNDPLCLDSLHDERPDLVEKYTGFLEQQYKAHRDLGKIFSRGQEPALTPEHLETLRSLGYIQ